MAGGAGCSWGAEGPWTLHAGPLPNQLLLPLAGHGAFYSWVPASEGLPRHLNLGLEMGELDARDPRPCSRSVHYGQGPASLNG